MAQGKLRVVVIAFNDNKPIKNALVKIFEGGNPNQMIMSQMTDEDGKTGEISLATPERELSEEPSAIEPYSSYNVEVSAQGYENVYISGVEILPEQVSVSNVALLPALEEENSAQSFVIGPHTLYGNYPPKIREDEIKDVGSNGEIVLSRVVIPEYIVVHDGPPSDASANDYYVKYTDYIKNVASSEIYATWEEAAIYANILAIMSFTLNRVYTEWYRGKGYDFTITSSTAYDHKWIYQRNIYDSISLAVDSIFNNYISRPGVTQPILTQYCDGKRVSCPNWLSQWGSNDLAKKGYSAIEILRYYYGNDIYINSTSSISGVPSSWPGYNLASGANGSKVLQLQKQLNVIAGAYPRISKIKEDGIYGQATANAIKNFQGIFNLPQTGITDFATWYKVSQIFVGVSRIAELI